MMRSAMVALVLLSALNARAQEVSPFGARIDGPEGDPAVGEETVLGRFSERGEHVGVYCHRTRAGLEAALRHDERTKNNPKADPAFYDRLRASGEYFHAAFGTPVTVLGLEEITGEDGGVRGKAVVVRFRGGPRRGQEACVWPHQTLRRRTKAEMEAERRAPRLPGALAKPHKPRPGELLLLGRMDLKSRVPDPHQSGIEEYPVVAAPVPAFTSMAAFRRHFAPQEGKDGGRKRPGGGVLTLPVTTRVYVVEMVSEDGPIPAAAVVSIAFGPGQGERYIVAAENVLEFTRILPEVPAGALMLEQDYSPITGRLPEGRRPRAKRPHSDAAPKSAPPATAGRLLQMGRGTEKNGNPSGAVGYYKELIEKFPDAPEAAEAKKRIEALETP